MSESMESIQQKFVARMLPDVPIEESALASAMVRPQRPKVLDEEIETLVHQIYLKEREHALHTVVFSGLAHGNGCSRVSCSAATVLARSTGPVCLVEANLHTPSLAAKLGVQKRPGLSEALLEDRPISSYVQTLSNNLSLVQAGSETSRASMVLMPERVKERLQQLRAEFGQIVIDSPPLSYVETLMLSHLSSGVVMVLEAKRTRRDEAASAAAVLRASGIEILGAVLNKSTPGALSQS